MLQQCPEKRAMLTLVPWGEEGMVTKSLVLCGGRVLQTGDTRPTCLDLVIGADGRIATLTPPRARTARAVFVGGQLVAGRI
jgi:hypothetical protein